MVFHLTNIVIYVFVIKKHNAMIYDEGSRDGLALCKKAIT